MCTFVVCTCVGCIGRLVSSWVSSVFLHLPILTNLTVVNYLMDAQTNMAKTGHTPLCFCHASAYARVPECLCSKF